MRIEELESTVARLKLGGVAVASEPQQSVSERSAEAGNSTHTEQKAEINARPTESESDSAAPYAKWGQVVKGVELAKASLRAPLAKAVALKDANGFFTVKIDAFFVRIIAENAENTAIVKGLIAEAEGISPADVKLSIIPKATGDVATLADELEKIIG